MDENGNCLHEFTMFKKEKIVFKNEEEECIDKEVSFNYCLNCNERWEDDIGLINTEEEHIITLYIPHDYLKDNDCGMYDGDDMENNLTGLNNL